MSKWSDFMAKLTGKAKAQPQPPAQTPTPAPAATPVPATESSEHAMQQTPDSTPPGNAETHGNPEPSPRQALSEYHVKDEKPAGRRGHTDSASRLYAGALIELAEQQGKLDEIASEVAQLDELFRDQAGQALERLFATPALGVGERRELIDRVFNGRISETLYRFIQVVNGKGRLASLPDILVAFDDLLDERRGIVEVDVHVAQRLSPDDADAVARRLGEALGKQIVLHQYVDESLIGGLILRVGDRLIDGSVATQLKSMRRTLVERGRQAARTNAGAKGPRGQGVE